MSTLRATNAERVHGLINAVIAATAETTATPSDARKIADFALSQRHQAGVLRTVSAETLASIAAIADRRDLAAWLGHHICLDDGTNERTASLWGLWVH